MGRAAELLVIRLRNYPYPFTLPIESETTQPAPRLWMEILVERGQTGRWTGHDRIYFVLCVGISRDSHRYP